VGLREEITVMVEPVEGITHRVQEIGRIRMGEKGPKGAPVKLKTFRLTSNDRHVLEAAAALYGGTVQAWQDAPDEGMWQLTTAAAELDILIPRVLRSVSQSWELWQGGTCERRCKGVTEEISGQPCICGDKRGEEGYCDIVTRVSVILPRLPGLGLWRLDTGGFHAATTIPATVDLLLALDPRPMVPAVLRAIQASTKVREDGKVITHRFVKPMLDAPGITIGQMVAGGPASEPALLEPGETRPTPPTAQERVARQRAEIEARRSAEPVDPVWSPAPEQSAPSMSAEEFDRLARAKHGLTTAMVQTAHDELMPGVKGADMTEAQWHQLAEALGLVESEAA
jgi:Recombination directionality factor-like